MNQKGFVDGFLERLGQPRLFLSAGMPRSGSTWVYNAARLILEKTTDDLSCGWIGDWRLLPVRGTVLLKVHEWDAYLAESAEVVLYSFRDLRDALASGKRKFGAEPTIDVARKWIADDCRWREAADVVVRYESMRENPRRALIQISDALPAKSVCLDSILMELERLAPPTGAFGTYDAATLLHPEHFTDGRYGTWHDWLPGDFVRRLETEFGSWFDENGYALSLRRGDGEVRKPQFSS